MLTRDLPFSNCLCPFHTKGDIYLNGQMNANKLGRKTIPGCREVAGINHERLIVEVLLKILVVSSK